MQSQEQVLDAWGDLACFSRPELKVERFSYPIITPSAARGIYDAIYCKPLEFRWQVTRVEVFAQPRYIALRRNEVKEKANLNAVCRWMEGTGEPEPIWADGDRGLLGSDEKGRTQRQTMALKDVRYRLRAVIRPWPGHEGRIQGMVEQFRRRASRGKCVYQPYFGCREFPAYFELAGGDGNNSTPVDLDLDVGLMLYDVFDLSRPGASEDAPFISLFRAKVTHGLLAVPPFESEEVLKPARGRR